MSFYNKQVMDRSQAYHDFVVLLSFAFWVLALLFTSLAKHCLFFLLPCLILSRKFFTNKFLPEKLPLKLITVLLIVSVLPYVLAIVHRDWDYHANLQWINQQNSWLIFYSFAWIYWFRFSTPKPFH